MAAFVLWGIFFPLVTYGAKDPSSVTSPMSLQSNPDVKTSKASGKKAPFKKTSPKKAALKPSLAKSAPPPVSAPAVKSVSSLPVVDTAALKLFPILNEDNAAVKGASATEVAAQGAVTTQKGVVQADAAALQTAKSQETALNRTLAGNVARVSQDSGVVATDTIELHRGDELLASATVAASSASANVDALTTQKQTLSQSATSSQQALDQTKQSIASLKAQIAGLNSIVSKDSPDATQKEAQIAKLKIQLQEKKNQQEAAQSSLEKDTATLSSLAKNLVDAQNTALAASKNLQSLQDSLKSNTAALAAAQKALGIEDSAVKAVQDLATTYALQAAEAEAAVAKEQIAVATLSTEEKRASTTILNDTNQIQTDKSTIVGNQSQLNWDNTYGITGYKYVLSQGETPWKAVIFYGITQPRDLRNQDTTLNAAILQLKKQISGLKMPIQEFQNATVLLTADKITSAKDASLLQVQDALLNVEKNKQKTDQAVIATDLTLVAQNTQGVSAAQQALNSDEESVFHLTQEAASDLSSIETGSTPNSIVSPSLSFQTAYDSLQLLTFQKDVTDLTGDYNWYAYGAKWAAQWDSDNNSTGNLGMYTTDSGIAAKILKQKNLFKQDIITINLNLAKLRAQEKPLPAILQNALASLKKDQVSAAQAENLSLKAQQALNLAEPGLSQWSKEISKELSSPKSLEALRGSVASDNASISSLNTDISQDKNALTQISSQYNADDPRLLADQKQLAQAKALYDTQSSALSEQKDHLTQLDATLDQASLSLQQSRNTVKAQTQKVSEDTTALRQAEQALTNAEQTVTTNSGTLTSLQSRVTQLQSTVSQSQVALDNLRAQAGRYEDTVTTLEQQKNNLQGEIQAQVSRYNDLVAQATTAREQWNNQGSTAAGQAYDALVQEIQSVNASLKTLGGQELPNLPFIPTNELNPVPPIVPSDDSADTSETPDITDNAGQDDGDTASEIDAQGDERDDALIAKRQDLSGGAIAPTPGLAGVVGAEAVTGDVTASTTSIPTQTAQPSQ